MGKDKTIVLRELKSAGFNVTLTDGVIRFIVPNSEFELQKDIVKKKLRELGYTASWGIRGELTDKKDDMPQKTSDESADANTTDFFDDSALFM